MKISIIIPSYNQGRFLASAIQSVIRQTQPEDEIFVVDGGSTDESNAIICEYRDKLTRFVCERDDGQANAVNKALKWASGDVIVWVNSDDALMPDSLSEIRKFWTPECRWMIFDSVWTNSDATLSTYYPAPDLITLNDFLDGAMPLNQPSCVISRALFLEVGALDESLRYALDFDLLVKCLKHSPPKIVHRLFGINRIHAQTKTSQRVNMVSELTQTAEKHFGISSRPYPRSFVRKYGVAYIRKYGLRFALFALLNKLFLRTGLPGACKVGLSRDIANWIGRGAQARQ